ncbi:hypothetical protein DN38_3196 [Vibrio cholerae]|nr:hypothetical protein DN38_3196 [Vibrio cholerae]
MTLQVVIYVQALQSSLIDNETKCRGTNDETCQKNDFSRGCPTTGSGNDGGAGLRWSRLG